MRCEIILAGRCKCFAKPFRKQNGTDQIVGLRVQQFQIITKLVFVDLQFQSIAVRSSQPESAPFEVMRWLPEGFPEDDLDGLSLPTGSRIAYDLGNNPVVLFSSQWAADYFPQTRTMHRVTINGDKPFYRPN